MCALRGLHTPIVKRSVVLELSGIRSAWINAFQFRNWTCKMREQPAGQAGSSRTRDRILQTTIELYREISHRKTTIADIAHRAAMSPANVYRFFRSKREIEEAVVAALLDEVVEAAARVAGGGGSPVHRLPAVLSAISQLHEGRHAHDTRLNDLIVVATDANWPIVLASVERIVGLLASMIAAGQARGEIREGSTVMLARCLLAAMNAHVTARQARAALLQPGFGEIMDFCIDALRVPPAGIAFNRRLVGQN